MFLIQICDTQNDSRILLDILLGLAASQKATRVTISVPCRLRISLRLAGTGIVKATAQNSAGMLLQQQSLAKACSWENARHEVNSLPRKLRIVVHSLYVYNTTGPLISSQNDVALLRKGSPKSS